MKTIRYFLSCMLVAWSTYSIQAQAQDIDLYSSVPSATGTDQPNVLFILDNSARFESESGSSCTYADGSGAPNMGTKTGGIEQCALVNAISALPLNTNGGAMVNVGIMVYNSAGFNTQWGCNASGNGGCLIKPLTAMTASGKAALIASIKSWTIANIKGNNEATAQAMQEAWAYYAAKTGMSGTTYTSNFSDGCQKNYVVFIGNAFGPNGKPKDASATPGVQLTNTVNGNAALTATQKTLLNTPIKILSAPYGTKTTCKPDPYTFKMVNHTETSGLFADEWARYMKSTDLATGAMPASKKIETYAIGVLGSDCMADYPALLTSMASKGGGKYFSTGNATEIQQAIIRIFNEVQAVNSVFASSSLPVSVNAQGTFLNQVYMGMFRPDPGGQPRWYGNLKQYQFIYNSSTKILQLADATSTPVISATTGFMSPNAASFWNCSSSSNSWMAIAPYTTMPTCNPAEPSVGFWANQPNGVGYAYDLPDGEYVEKGGAAMVMRLANLTDDYTATPGSATNPRHLYTYCPSGSGCTAQLAASANAFDTSNTAITDALLGTGSVAINSITSAATVQGGGVVPGASGAAATVSITAFAKSGNKVTATVSAASATALGTFVPNTTQIKIATGASKFDCPGNVCVVTGVNTGARTFTYNNAGGNGTPTVPYTATIFTNFVTVTSNNHGLPVGQTVTFSACTTYTTLNGTLGTITAVTTNTFTAATTVSLTGTASDAGCKFTPNTATVTTTAAHGLPAGASVTIAGATPAGYNGVWTAAVTGATTFTYQYTVAAPLANFAGAGATVASSSISRDTLTRWVRGEDNYGDEQSLCPPGTVVTAGTNCSTFVNIRPSVHGDVLHSRPVVINYGGSTGVLVFYGANDGVFRAVNGNQTAAVGSVPAGGELWGFIPSEFYSNLKRLHDNSPIVQGPSTLTGIVPAPQPKDYFADGSTGVYQLIKADGTTQTAYIYIAMRRGGRLIYALDVSTPTDPKFLWKHSNTDAGFAELGQTWSQPKVAMVKGYATPVLIFAAGYDPAEDSEPPAADTMGRGIFILDATTGALVWKATYGGALSCPNATAACTLPEMKYSIPSDITLLDHNNDGKIDRLYVGDVGGNIWRVDLEPTAGNTPDKWQVEKLAALGCATGPCAAGTTPRKFLYPPEVMSIPAYDAVFAGSGDREHPLWSTTANSACQVANRLYMLKDTKTGPDGSGLTTITEAALFDSTIAPYDGSLSGYYISLAQCEKAVNAPLAVAGYVYFGTSKKEGLQKGKCEEPLGEAAPYKLKAFAGTYKVGEWESGGLPPSPVAGVVNVVDSVTGKTMQVPFCIGCGQGEADHQDQTSTCDGSALAACRPPLDVSTSRNRTYWYMNTD